MPHRPCKHPTCTALVAKGAWCDAHKHLAPEQDRRAYHREYDQRQRDAEAKAFYNSPGWKKARGIKLAADPVCERCQRAFANTVHHKKPLRECTAAERVAQSNLLSVCPPCHAVIEAEIAAGRAA